jgi:subtilisin family serine protease
VRFKPEAREGGLVTSNIATEAHAKVGSTVIKEFNGVPGLQLASLPTGVTVPAAITKYRQNPNVLYAEPDYLRYEDAVPNDPYFGNLWGLHNTGQMVKGALGARGADIDAPEAWDKTTGSNDVVVAVLDTGVDYRAPDLAPNIIEGYDFITNSSDPMDRDGHGTQVAGIIAAAGNNGIGVTGVLWEAKIMPLRVIGSGIVAVDTEIAAIDYANSRGARIINMSFGGNEYSQAEKDAIDASPAVCICSAGNDGYNNDQRPNYPGSYTNSNIITVAATDPSDALVTGSYWGWGSNYGPHSVHVAAPGVNVLSTSPPAVQVFSDPMNNTTSWNAQPPWDASNLASSPLSAAVNSPSGSAVNASITLQNPVDLTGKCGTKLEFNTRMNTIRDHGLFYIEASRDGVNWDTIDYGSGNSNGWIRLEYSLTNYDDSPYLNIRFRLTTDASMSSSSADVSGLSISAFNPSNGEQHYSFISGTSAATPYVSGLAGLVKAVNPNYTNLQIKDAILKNVDVKSSLRGKISTEGRINASKTLSGVAPAPTPTPLPEPTPTPEPTPPPSLAIMKLQLVPNHTQYLEWDIINTGDVDAFVAPQALFYKQTAVAPGYAKIGNATALSAYDSTTGSSTTVSFYAGYGWFYAQAGHTYRVFSGPIVPSDAKWAVYNAQLYYNGTSQGWLYTSGGHYSILR